jgi:hypothetical protein
MKQTTITFTNETITDIYREGYNVWVATKPLTGNAKLYKISALNPEVIYYTITTEFSTINKIVGDSTYIYITGEWTTYSHSKYSITDPLGDYYHIAAESGYEAYEGQELCYDSTHSMIAILFKGESSQTPVIFIYDAYDILYQTVDFDESLTTISNPAGLVKDETNDMFYLSDNSGDYDLVKIDVNNYYAITITPFIESYVSGNPVNSIINGTTIYTTLDSGILVISDVTDPNAITFEFVLNDESTPTITGLNDLFLNVGENKLYLTGTPNESIYTIDLSESFFSFYEFEDVGDTVTGIVGYSDYKLYFLISGSNLIVVDNSTNTVMMTDFRTQAVTNKYMPTLFNLNRCSQMRTDFRTAGFYNTSIQTDFRYKPQATGVSYPLLPRTTLIIQIDGVTVEAQDIKLDSLKIIWNDEQPSTASFIMCRRHDKLDYTLLNTYCQITNKNAITVSFDGNVFTGIIDNYKPVSTEEIIQVECVGEIRAVQSNTVNLPLPSVDEQMQFYHIINWSADIKKPTTAYDIVETDKYGNIVYEDGYPKLINPSFYKGVKINQGTSEIETGYVPNTWMILYGDNPVANPFGFTGRDFSKWNPVQGYEYFWQITADCVNPDETSTNYGIKYRTAKYIGKDGAIQGQLGGDLWSAIDYNYLQQKPLVNVITELGYYYIGSYPFEEVSGTNGKYVAIYHWEDRSDGLYYVKNKNWDNVSYAQSLANARFNQMKTSNGVAANSSSYCETNANITITMQAFKYYNIGMLTKINIVNTTQSGIYTNLNGFPVRPKTITLDFSSMTVSLQCDNMLTLLEKKQLEYNVGDAPAEKPEWKVKVYQKFDINRGANIV